MIIVQRANKQLRISDDMLDEYKKQGYKEISASVKTSNFNKTSKKNETPKNSEKERDFNGGDA